MSDPPAPAVRVTLRPLGSPITIGMAGLGIASLVQTGVELHWTATDQIRQAGLILIAVPFVLQLLACIFSVLCRDGATGAAVGILSTTWLALGLIHLTTPRGTNGPLGLLLVGAAGGLLLTASTLAAEKGVPALAFGVAGVRFAAAGIYQLSGVAALDRAAGDIGLAVSVLAGYALVAFELEGQRRAMLPTLRRGRARETIAIPRVDPAAVAREPGVRDSL